MRKIEQQMLGAISAKKNFTSGNTSVSISEGGGYATITLHGNMIARVDYNLYLIQLWDGGWQSNTTKSRLNALASLCFDLHGIFQEKWEWYTRIKREGYGYVQPFENGEMFPLK